MPSITASRTTAGPGHRLPGAAMQTAGQKMSGRGIQHSSVPTRLLLQEAPGRRRLLQEEVTTRAGQTATAAGLPETAADPPATTTGPPGDKQEIEALYTAAGPYFEALRLLL